MTTHCRFCGQPFEVLVPEDEMAARMIKQCATRACCNRCADHHRGQRDLTDVLQKVALMFRHGTSDEKPKAKECIDEVCKLLIGRAEKHYLVSGFAQYVGDMVANVVEKPEFAAYFARQAENGIKQEAMRLSAVQSVSEPEYAF